MSGDPYKKAQPGERLRIPAVAWNRVLDMVRPGADFLAGEEFAYRKTNFQVYCRNDSGSAVGRWGVLAITGVTPVPSGATGAATNQFETFPGVVGVLATGTTYSQFVVAVEPIAVGAMGLAAIDGVVQVKLDIVDVGHKFATPKAASTELKTAAVGEATILWKEPGVTGPGKWGLVRIGDGAGGGVRLGKYEPTGTTGAWSIDSIADVNLYEDGTPPSESLSDEILEDVVNHSRKVSHGSWVLCERSPAGTWYLVESGATGPCKMSVGGDLLTDIGGYNAMDIQVLGHTAMASGPSGPTGCAELQWYSVTGCTGATGA